MAPHTPVSQFACLEWILLQSILISICQDGMVDFVIARDPVFKNNFIRLSLFTSMDITVKIQEILDEDFFKKTWLRFQYISRVVAASLLAINILRGPRRKSFIYMEKQEKSLANQNPTFSQNPNR